jgi:predicted MFS family arabinose efflux permease
MLNRDQRRMQVSGLLWGFGISLFLYIQPLYIASLGASPAQIVLVLGLSGGLVTFLYIPIGLWADRRGRKPVILAGWGLGAAATFAIALAPDWRWLIPAMSVYMLSNFAMPAFHGYIAASDRGGNLSRTMAVIAAGSSIGSIVSPALGGWIGEQFGLRAVYLCAAVAFTLSTLALWGLTDQPAERHVVTGSPVQLLSNRSFLWQVLFILLLFFAIDLGQVMMPKFLEDVRGLSVGQIGWLGTAGSLGVVLFSLVLGHLPVERREALLLGQLLALTAGVLVLRTPLPAFILLAYFVHGNNRVVRPLVIGRLARNLDSTTMSFGYGFYETAMRLGLAMSPLVAGLLYARQPTWPLYAGVAGLSLTMLLTFTLPAAGRAPAPAVVLAASAQGAALPGVEATTGSGKAG